MIYVFLKVVPKYYKHQSAVTLHKVFPRFDRNTLRLVEEKVIRGAVLAAERTTKNFLQILLSKLVILQFTSLTNPLTKDLPVVGGYIPLWGGQFNTRGSGFTSACENTYAGSESVSVFISSIGFWLLMPMCFHLNLPFYKRLACMVHVTLVQYCTEPLHTHALRIRAAPVCC